METRGLRFASLLFACSAMIAAQGLTTTQTKDQWEEVNFEFNSSVLSDGYPSLLRLAELLHSNPDYRVTLEGNTDSIGSQGYNGQLANARAQAVKAFLVKYGASADQVTVVAHGKQKPEASNKTREGRFINRRVQMTVRDGQGRVVGAGGVGEAIKAMQASEQAQRKCCEEVLKRLDKLDEILAAIKDLKAENDKLKQDVANLKQAQAGVQQQVATLPHPPEKAELQQMMEQTADKAVQKAKPNRFSLLGVNVGPTLSGVTTPVSHSGAGNITFSGKGRYFAPFGRDETHALQADAEYLYFRDRQEGQFDLGLVNRWTRMQAGLFSSIKHVNVTDIGGGTLGQAAFTTDVLFSRGKLGFFGTKGFLNNQVIGRTPFITPSGAQSFNIWNEHFLKIVDQVGGSAEVGLWNNAYVEGNFGALFRSAGSDRPGGTVRLVQPISDRLAFTTEASLNTTLVGSGNNGRIVFGLEFGNWVRPKEFMTVKHPVPVDVPRLRYEVLTRRVQTGHTPPVADAGGDQIGVPAGAITLDGSASYSPDGLPLTYSWTQIAGPTVQIANADQAKASFTAAEGETYQFRLAVKDSTGSQAIARTTVTTKAAPAVRIARFTANPANINAGQSTTLAWEVENADTVEISGIGPVNAKAGTAGVAPTQTTAYTLTAKNAKGQVNEVLTVTVNQSQLRIVDFQANPTSIAPGQSAMLHWQTENADTVTISGVGTVAQSGSTSVSPKSTTTYTLTASNSTGQVTANVTVSVNVAAPIITSFTVSPTAINAGGSAMLAWQVQNATSVTISGIGDVPGAGSRSVSPSQTTTYTLTATNAGGNTTSSVTLTVNPGATITSFIANPATINAGQSSTLSWTTQNATSASIEGIGYVTPNGSVDVSPKTTTTYTLRVAGAGATVTKQVTVTVNTPGGGAPVAVIAGPANLVTEQFVLVLGATGSTNPGGGALTYRWSGPADVLISSPDSATTMVTFRTIGNYTLTLTVTNSQGQSSTATVAIMVVPMGSSKRP